MLDIEIQVNAMDEDLFKKYMLMGDTDAILSALARVPWLAGSDRKRQRRSFIRVL